MTAPLDAIQAFFAGAIQAPVPVSETRGMVAGNARMTPLSQLEVYREQFWLRHVDALEEDFVTVARLVGHDAFHVLAERYLAAHPCPAFSLRDLGAHFARFVASAAPYRDDPLLSDCARLEWAFVEAFDAADAAPIGADVIASIAEDAWPAARLTLHPALQLVSLGHAAHDYRAAVRAGEEPSRPLPSPVCVAVYRGPETLQYIEVEPLAFDLLGRLGRGEALGAACEAVAAVGEGGEAALEEKVGGWFSFWAASGWLTAISSR